MMQQDFGSTLLVVLLAFWTGSKPGECPHDDVRITTPRSPLILPPRVLLEDLLQRKVVHCSWSPHVSLQPRILCDAPSASGRILPSLCRESV
ncbi:hypothetical protein FB45DRAFT_950854 [Roridomyces roridus]|uniref:Secreted protein n=1 Tax=Roridomyces roridus TaxID=1738132 RepID=A0AAD7AZZ2_9AGAR|nr:hypothetical protein FB45DRAFT_950854 [Roridomyces roridus]